ncbi:hypothetical protein [Bradyrhizobium sp. sBnM-33]|uniref:hypothetical protein n=1 Tax=Bradyrhizobium sp. sBnM-33 TaxID=2831780 RepID=UPI00293E9E52|nr:hypothetical protein [Bradyrhizobium sp. sBnM-33]WOH48818.1 hypothetical protein RX328_32720 [Bradyrhizobium sp. sBnM-33]
MAQHVKAAETGPGTHEIYHAIAALGEWLETADYRGNDPYQLDSVITQAAGRPIIGPLVGFARKVLKPYHGLIPRRVFSAAKPILIPQALGDALSGEGFREPDEPARRRARRLFTLIGETRSPLARNDAWGLPFPWGGADRHPPHWPTAISTTFVVNGLLDALHLLDRAAAIARLESALRFLLEECGVEETDAGPCVRFGPGDNRLILNVSAAAAAVMVRIGELLGRDELLDFAHRALRLVAHHQNPNGSWYYAPAHGSHALDTIIDSRHTGYILEGLVVGNARFRDPVLEAAIEAGWNYVETTLLDDEMPRWSPQQTWPVDSHDVAQSILTALSLGKIKLADRHVVFAMRRFHRGGGLFRYKLFEDGRSNDAVFVRWTQAPMYKALARYWHKR